MTQQKKLSKNFSIGETPLSWAPQNRENIGSYILKKMYPTYYLKFHFKAKYQFLRTILTKYFKSSIWQKKDSINLRLTTTLKEEKIGLIKSSRCKNSFWMRQIWMNFHQIFMIFAHNSNLIWYELPPRSKKVKRQLWDLSYLNRLVNTDLSACSTSTLLTVAKAQEKNCFPKLSTRCARWALSAATCRHRDTMLDLCPCMTNLALN